MLLLLLRCHVNEFTIRVNRWFLWFEIDVNVRRQTDWALVVDEGMETVRSYRWNDVLDAVNLDWFDLMNLRQRRLYWMP